ncbi:MAG: DNA translocase FtsK 4TM domain-containing protein [Candidatus Methanofishera endochildressiae]|uniref:DNA translocase FtsK 4TM domain-containing protein n=1 Tax=Candidatus Methanofishera endochildressiae TaxID=2738884 RepID=A0A7Z0MP88_9GAMM|nr:DNA translocase FtsK 4TM domain-containing protein [Candidatus Methanofishera endochildressiae]
MAAVMEERSVRGLRETALLGFIVVALFYLISLISFSHEDAGWSKRTRYGFSTMQVVWWVRGCPIF